jgi:hypothetical protein
MQLKNDDDIATVDNVFLGPKGWLLPWKARYISYGIGLLLFIVAFALEHRLGVQTGIWSIVFTVMAVVGATQYLGKYISHETPLRALGSILWEEMTAPRQETKSEHACLRPGKVKNTMKGIRTHESRF